MFRCKFTEVKTHLVAVPPSPSLYLSCSELMCSRASLQVSQGTCYILLASSLCEEPLCARQAPLHCADCSWTRVSRNPQLLSGFFEGRSSKPLCSFTLLVFSGKTFYFTTLSPQLLKQTVAPKPAASVKSDKQHVPLWEGAWFSTAVWGFWEHGRRWWGIPCKRAPSSQAVRWKWMTGGVSSLRVCGITKV